jgi:outer membrane lipoprotein-sorting protein
MTIQRRAFIALVPAWILSTRSALADSVDDALKEMAKARKDITTLKADFKQVRQIGLLASEVHSSGKMWLVRPDRLRWELAPPDAVIYWIGPEGIAVKTGDGVTKIGKTAAGKLGAVLEDLLVLLGGDLAKLRKRYELSVERPEGKLVLSARPKDAELKKQVALLRMTADSSLWRVESMVIEETSGDNSRITFRSYVKNEPIDPAIMKPPK